ncbi:hypothetical protein WT25_22155 [Burkholderia territorii]|nr:hypothetical protein WT25_22155 [Burkholderia territorii]
MRGAHVGGVNDDGQPASTHVHRAARFVAIVARGSPMRHGEIATNSCARRDGGHSHACRNTRVQLFLFRITRRT